MGRIGLPDIQRPFVWTNAKIRNLLDSMYKGYPVGYLLFWENGLLTEHRTIGADAKQLAPDLVIVDGQQRLTSLYAVIKGAQVLRRNYQTERIRIAFNPITEVFEVSSAAIERDRAFIPDITPLLSGESSVFRVVADYLEALKATREVSESETRTIEDSIVKLQGLSGFPFTALQLSADMSEEHVADVFVRINSQGKTLNQADFILTLMSVFWDEGRAELESFCRESRYPVPGQISPYNHFIQPYPVQLLRVSVGLAFKRARLQNVYSILRGKDMDSGEFSASSRVNQFETLKTAQTQVLDLQHWHDFMQCIRRAGYRGAEMINSENALLYSYVLYLIGRTEFHVEEHELRTAIAQWFFMSAVTSRYTGSFETTMEADFAMLRDAKNSEGFVAQLRRACDISLTSDFWNVQLPNMLASTAAKSPSLFAYQASLVLLGAPGLFSKYKIAEWLDPTAPAIQPPIERLRLFSQSHLATRQNAQTSDHNQIANYAYLDSTEGTKIGNKAPNEYLPNQEGQFSQTELAEMYRFHALPDGWENLDYLTFLERRRGLIAQIIRAAYESLTADSASVVEPLDIDLSKLIAGGESNTVEFKSTLRVNLHTGKGDHNIEHAALKTIAGFLNARGGTLIIGVADDGTPTGLGHDNFQDEDGMALHLTHIVNDRMGPKTWLSLHPNFDDFQDTNEPEDEETRVLIVKCEPSDSPVYLKDGNQDRFYVRTGNATIELPTAKAVDYIQARFSG